MKNISNNPGILPINLGHALLRSSSHQFIHYFDISKIIQEFNKLSTQYEHFNKVLNKGPNFKIELENDFKVINYLQNLIKEKLAPFHANSKTKRGLVDGIGTIIKQITGNLDSTDAEHFENLILEIKRNQKDVAKQINKQYTINEEIMSNFNKTINDVEHNEILLKARINLLSSEMHKISEYFNQLHVKDIFQQMINLFSVILNISQDIENSITFCNLKMLHPTIITKNQLFAELQKISKFYGNKLPFPIIMKELSNYESLIKPKCLIKNQEIIYLITIPLFETMFYELYYFLPIPTNQFYAILPSSKFALKSEQKLLPLNDVCVHISDRYYCDKKQITFTNITCEEEILSQNQYSNCQYIKLNIEENNLEYIEELNVYIGIFVKEEIITENCQGTWNTIPGKGTYIFNEECETRLNNKLLIFNDTTSGHPINLETPRLQIHENTQSPVQEVKLRHLKIKELGNIQQIHIPEEKHIITDYHHISILIILFTAISILSGYTIIQYYYRRSHPQSGPPSTQKRLSPEEIIF